jgi:hypothetical protein
VKQSIAEAKKVAAQEKLAADQAAIVEKLDQIDKKIDMLCEKAGISVSGKKSSKNKDADPRPETKEKPADDEPAEAGQ